MTSKSPVALFRLVVLLVAWFVVQPSQPLLADECDETPCPQCEDFQFINQANQYCYFSLRGTLRDLCWEPSAAPECCTACGPGILCTGDPPAECADYICDSCNHL
jgi:hypothetical protein